MRASLFRSYLRLRHRRLLRRLDEIERTQWLPAAKIRDLQIRKLRDILAHAKKTVPYYRELFQESGFDPSGVRSTEDITRLPLIDRKVLATRFDDLISTDTPSAMVRSTGGSTGRPTRFAVDRDEMTWRSAHIYRHLRWLGWDLGDRIAYVWGSDIDARDHRGWRAAIRDRLVGHLWLDAFRMHPDRLDDDIRRIQDHSPAVMIGYPSSLHLLAERLLVTGHRLALRGVQTSAEMLAPRVRADLERAFGCKVLDRYGCREAGVIAHECPEGRLHVNAEAVTIESVDGEVVVTTLNNRTMPLIRYRNEDLALLSDETCGCGRGLPLMRAVKGRLSDVIRSPSGKLIHGEFFTHLFYDVPGVSRFQVRQTTPRVLRIAVVADPSFTASARGRLAERILQHADAAFDIEWIDVREIPPGPSGKYLFTISDVHGPGGDGV